MSEAYGLKVSLFVIKQILLKTLQEKSIQGDPIYMRLLLVDTSGRPLIDTASESQEAFFFSSVKTAPSPDEPPIVFIDQENNKIKLVLKTPCILQGEVMGSLISILNLDTVRKHFVDFSPNPSLDRFDLVSNDGRIMRSDDAAQCPDFRELTSMTIHQLPEDQFSLIKFPSERAHAKQMMVTRVTIHNVPLYLLSWVEKKTITGTLTPWQSLLGTAFLALMILLGIVKLVKFNTENLVLQTRYDESKRQQHRLASKNQQLKHEISQRQKIETELEEQRSLQMRSDRLRSLGEMAAGIAHELNQPLVGVRGKAELTLLSLAQEGPLVPQKIENNVQTIIEQVDRMVHIIDHVRLFARNAGKVEISRVDLNDIVCTALTLVMVQFKSYDLHLEKILAPRKLFVLVNPFSVEEVIFNLLTNARDAVESKKKEAGQNYRPDISIRTGSDELENQKNIWIEIKDNGSGIPESIIPSIFDPFFTTKDPDKGTGLGLSICKSIVEEFGGTIDLESREGEGTAFIIHFPECRTPTETDETIPFP
ncbi:MAG: hypothetical protein KKE53_04605 [Proteobacteria bacterium]|nr:hypothetical protein [Pseudomonadota bacterium]